MKILWACKKTLEEENLQQIYIYTFVINLFYYFINLCQSLGFKNHFFNREGNYPYLAQWPSMPLENSALDKRESVAFLLWDVHCGVAV